jgi:type IV secretion system protein VirD4
MRWLILLVVLLLVLAFARWAYLPHGRLPRFRVANMRLRLALRLHPGRGHASALEIWRRWGRFAAWRKSRQARPSLTTWHRFRHPDAHSIFLGRAQYRMRLRLPVETHAVIQAPPRQGKSALLADVILRKTEGPVLSTTTKPDVFWLTSGVRSRVGTIEVFNPANLGGVPSTFAWNVCAGCQDPAVAIRRADGFSGALKVEGDNAFFANAARGFLRAMLHAAGLVGADLRLVQHWVMTAPSGGAIDAEAILRQNGAHAWADELATLRGPADKTNAANQMCLVQAIGFMANPALARSVMPAEGEGIDFADFLTASGTLYMIAASDEHSPVAPLFAAMANEVHFQAKQLASYRPNGRLDPPLLMALDEVTQICPVPLNAWMADSGGVGIQIIAVTHGESQLADRFGEFGKRTVLDTAGCLVYLPGITDPSMLDAITKLCGTCALKERGQDHHSRIDVMTPAMIRALPFGYALIIRGGMSPIVAKLPKAWRNSEYRKAQRHGKAVAAITVAATAALDSPLARIPVASLRRPEGASELTDGSEREIAEVTWPEPEPELVDVTERPWSSS